MSRVVIIGCGQIGKAFLDYLPRKEGEAWARSNIDYLDNNVLFNRLKETKPDIVINTAAYTDVDRAQKTTEYKNVLALNALLPMMLAQYGQILGYKLIHFSTAYVFDGMKKTPYVESDPTNPINVYGNTKEIGEMLIRKKNNVKIFRVQAVYSNHGNCFPNTMERLMGEQHTIDVVGDQITVPTHAEWIAETVIPIMESDKHGLWHLCPNGSVSYADFAKKVVDGRCHINPISSYHYATPAKRPLNTVLDNSKIKADFGLSIPSWERVYDVYKF